MVGLVIETTLCANGNACHAKHRAQGVLPNQGQIVPFVSPKAKEASIWSAQRLSWPFADVPGFGETSHVRKPELQTGILRLCIENSGAGGPTNLGFAVYFASTPT